MLEQKIEQDFIEAYKAKNEVVTKVLRLIKTAIKNERVARMKELADDEILTILVKQAKQRKDSIAQFSSAGRDDLVAIEEAELAVLEHYLPQPITGTELQDLVKEIIASLQTTSIKDTGKIIQQLNKKYPGAIDGAELSACIKLLLQ